MKVIQDIENKACDLTRAKEALAIQIKGLISLNQVLDHSFQEAIEILFALKGRVIVSGMGKSGHIARKIAATLASTGSPAYFVHPAEASHGDLGMICEEDAIILLSNSGETKELSDIINYAKRFSIPLISIVRKQGSTLEKASNICLLLPNISEACSINVPTTSTTMMLALGDLLAICLLERRRFDRDCFKIFHPGGKIGADLLKVKELMHIGEEIPYVYLDDKISSVLLTITSKKFGCAAVLDEKKQLKGIITDGDLRRHISSDFLNKKASEIMTENPLVIQEEELASLALNRMNKKSITCLLVVRERFVKGIIHIHDCLRAGIK